jgi:hypothetical protein
VDAQPLFNRLRDKFKGKVRFAGIIDVNPKKAQAWAGRNAMSDPLISDATRKTIHAYKATNSAFSALLMPDGTIDKMWPGYSKEYLLDMNQRISKAVRAPETPLDVAFAPITRTAGCSYEP